VIEKLCDQARGETIAVADFYYDILARKDQIITNVISSIPKLLVGKEIPEHLH